MTSCPSTAIVPPVMSCRREKQRTSVDFPDPDRPMMTSISPRATSMRHIPDAGDIAIRADLLEAAPGPASSRDSPWDRGRKASRRSGTKSTGASAVMRFILNKAGPRPDARAGPGCVRSGARGSVDPGFQISSFASSHSCGGLFRLHLVDIDQLGHFGDLRVGEGDLFRASRRRPATSPPCRPMRPFSVSVGRVAAIIKRVRVRARRPDPCRSHPPMPGTRRIRPARRPRQSWASS